MSQDFKFNDKQYVEISSSTTRATTALPMEGPVPRTPIPARLIHQSREVERNAHLFDQLCRLAEDAAFPCIQAAVVRETAATGAETLTTEAKLALDGLVEEAALESLEDQGVLDQVRKSLEGAILPPDENECRALARDMAQLLMGTWLEMLRSALSKTHQLLLSDHLLVRFDHLTETKPFSFMTMAKFFGRSAREDLALPQPLSDALSSFALNDHEVRDILATLRRVLFPEPRLVELPFELVMVGAPEMVLAMTGPRCQHILEEAQRTTMPASARHSGAIVSANSRASTRLRPERHSAIALAPDITAVDLCVTLSQDDYRYFSEEASRVSQMDSVTG